MKKFDEVETEECDEEMTQEMSYEQTEEMEEVQTQELEEEETQELQIEPKDELVEICYWRKCWGIRNEIVLHLKKCNPDIEYAYKTPLDELDGICDIINKFTKEYYYNMYARSIWDWDEMVDKLKLQITRLEWCKELLKEDKIELEFYDSY